MHELTGDEELEIQTYHPKDVNQSFADVLQANPLTMDDGVSETGLNQSSIDSQTTERYGHIDDKIAEVGLNRKSIDVRTTNTWYEQPGFQSIDNISTDIVMNRRSKDVRATQTYDQPGFQRTDDEISDIGLNSRSIDVQSKGTYEQPGFQTRDSTIADIGTKSRSIDVRTTKTKDSTIAGTGTKSRSIDVRTTKTKDSNLADKGMNSKSIDVQSKQLYEQQGFQPMDGGITDVGIIDTTLEMIFSDDTGDQASYGYSLDEGLKSKPSLEQASATGSDTTDDETFERDSVDISLGSLDTASDYSNLTGDDNGDYYSYIIPEVNIQKKTHLFERVVIAPAGKLSIIIDTTNDGPVVYEVKEGSPLKGMVFPGDRIISIDEIKTRGMTANNITKIMARKANIQRMITLANEKSFKNL